MQLLHMEGLEHSLRILETKTRCKNAQKTIRRDYRWLILQPIVFLKAASSLHINRSSLVEKDLDLHTNDFKFELPLHLSTVCHQQQKKPPTPLIFDQEREQGDYSFVLTRTRNQLCFSVVYCICMLEQYLILQGTTAEAGPYRQCGGQPRPTF